MHAHDASGREKSPGHRQAHLACDAEADRQNDQPAEQLSSAALLTLQRAIGNAAVARLRGEQGAVQRSTVPDVVGSPGRPLEEPVRTEMESRLGADFSDVRVHTDETARHSAAEIGARAYTAGSHVVLGESGTDRHTLAHELVHVLQQRVGPVSGSDTGRGFQVSDPADRFEREADAVASRALAQSPPSATTTTDEAPAHPSHPDHAQVQRVTDDEMDLDDLDVDMTIAELKEDGLITDREVVLSSHAFMDALAGEITRSAKWNLVEGAGGNRYAETKQQGHPKPNEIEKSPEVRALEAVSIVTKTYLQDTSEEVQAAIDSSGRLVIAANRSFNNKALAESLGKGTEQEVRDFVSNAPAATSTQKNRQGKVNKLLEGIGGVADKYSLIKSALARGVVVASVGGDEMHAELRIKQHNGGTPTHLAGTKRPCTACFAELYPDGSDKVRPGVLYLSPRALAGVPEYQKRYGSEKSKAEDYFKRIDKLIAMTYQAVDKKGKKQYGGAVTDWDDSDEALRG